MEWIHLFLVNLRFSWKASRAVTVTWLPAQERADRCCRRLETQHCVDERHCCFVASLGARREANCEHKARSKRAEGNHALSKERRRYTCHGSFCITQPHDVEIN